MAAGRIQDQINSIRKFNRFYTKQIGLLNQGLLQSRYPLTHVRILFEIAQVKETTASGLIEQLDLDPGYVSRILKFFEKEGLVRVSRSQKDSRHAFSQFDFRRTQDVRRFE